MAKRVAVLVRERQEEGLRVSLGLTLAGCAVEVYVLAGAAEPSPGVREYLDALADTGVPVALAVPGPGDLPLLEPAAIARRLLACDHVVAY